jgi:hypothetical protein
MIRRPFMRHGPLWAAGALALVAGCSDHWTQVSSVGEQRWRIRIANCGASSGDLLKQLQDAAIRKCAGSYELGTPSPLAANARGNPFGECAHPAGVESVVHCMPRPASASTARR